MTRTRKLGRRARREQMITISMIIALVALVIGGFFLVKWALQPVEELPQLQVEELEDDSKDLELNRLEAELEAAHADNQELLAENARLHEELEQHMLRCSGCPFCNGTSDLDELNAQNGKKLPTSGKALGDGKGNGAGTGGKGSITPVYDTNVEPSADGKIHVDTPDVSMDFSGDDDWQPSDIVVDTTPEEQPSQPTQQPSIEQPEEEFHDIPEEEEKMEQVELSYEMVGDATIVVKAPQGYTAADIYSYIVTDVVVNSAVVEGSVLTLTYESDKDSEVELCEGLFVADNGISKKLVVPVKANKLAGPIQTEKPEEKPEQQPADTQPQQPSIEQPETGSDNQPETPEEEEMVVNEINVEALYAEGYAGETFQYVISVDGINVDFTKLSVSIGSVSSDGTWSFVAPAESGVATISFGAISESVEYTVLSLVADEEVNELPSVSGGNNDVPEEEPEEKEEETVNPPVVEEEPPVDDNGEAGDQDAEPEQQPQLEVQPQPEVGPSVEEPIVTGKLTGIEMYETAVICGSDIQGDVFFEGEVDWTQVTVSGLNGLSYDLTAGTITIHTEQISAWYTVVVSYNGTSVSAEFAVQGVQDPEIAW